MSNQNEMKDNRQPNVPETIKVEVMEIKSNQPAHVAASIVTE